MHYIIPLDHDTLDTDTLSATYVDAVTHQDELGWINFIRGRHGIQFQSAYDQYLAELPTKKKLKYKSGKAWATALVEASLTLLVEIWYVRHDQCNRPDTEDTTMTPRITELHNRVRETYQQRMD